MDHFLLCCGRFKFFVASIFKASLLTIIYMCGRFSFSISRERVEQDLGIAVNIPLRISYNIAPTHHAYVISNDRPKELQYMTWGLIPYWSKDGKNTGKLINARKEGIASKISFRLPIRRKRCLILADSFYEWRKEGKRKIPYRILLKDKPFLTMAGIWDVWYNGDYEVKSFSIITTTPNKEMEALHTRMPIIFDTPSKQKAWLEDSPILDVLEQLETLEDDKLSYYRVSEKLNSPQNNSPDLHLEIPEPPTLF